MGRRPGHSNLVRIIGGSYRGRKITFPDAAGLRPTSDRVRETLFNWLQPVIEGARCLDLFAGSGALGFEAASRGARQVVMVEKNPMVAAQLKRNAELLGAKGVEIVIDDASSRLQRETASFDIVFIDPPFAGRMLDRTVQPLIDNGLLNEGAYVYLENDAKDKFPTLPPELELTREKQAGQVHYALAHYRGDEKPSQLNE